MSGEGPARVPGPASQAPDGVTPPPSSEAHRASWSELMRRVCEVDVLHRDHCEGRRELIAQISDRLVTRRMLRHLGLPSFQERIWPLIHLAPDPSGAGSAVSLGGAGSPEGSGATDPGPTWKEWLLGPPGPSSGFAPNANTHSSSRGSARSGASALGWLPLSGNAPPQPPIPAPRPARPPVSSRFGRYQSEMPTLLGRAPRPVC